MGSAVALVGFAGAANASATVDLIWADTGTNEISSVVVSDHIQLNVILTAGPNGAFGADVSVDYSEVLGLLAVVGYASTPSGPELPVQLGAPYDTGDRIETINSTASPYAGIGLPAGQSHQLGTVTFHNIALVDGVFEIWSDADGPTNGVGDLFYNNITDTTTFNSAFVFDGPPPPTPTVTPTAGATNEPTATPMSTPTPTPGVADCLCEVQNINPNQITLKNVGSGGKGSTATRKMVLVVEAVDAPGATCDPGEFSAPTPVNLMMVDDDGDGVFNDGKTIVCGGGRGSTTVKLDVFFQGPLNCENGAVPPPKPDFSLGTIMSTGSAPGTADYVEDIKIKCFE
jgi:hypothetical protein